MTDKQIACAYLAGKLSAMIPDHGDLRYLAETDLTEERCNRIVQRIIEMTERVRQPLVDHLSRSGIDAH